IIIIVILKYNFVQDFFPSPVKKYQIILEDSESQKFDY
ncbi:MAG: hypothetical protein ACI8RD_014793, partial [Bacillariaceae sp.]